MLVHRVGFGTVAGWYTVSELKDLVAAKDATMRNLAREFSEISPLPFDFTVFLPAYQALTERYQAARAVAQKAIDDAVGAWRPTNMILADTEYRGLLASLNSRWEEHTWAPGDGSIEDLSDQLAKFGATGKGAEPIPQPQKGSDVDLTTMQQSDQVLKGLSNLPTLFDTKHLVLYAIVGGVVVLFVLPRVLAWTPAGMMARRVAF